MNKRGQGLPMNTVIVAILVIVVLVVVVVFFLGGFAGLSSKVKAIFYGTTAGTDLTLAVQTCESRCEQAMLLPKSTLGASAFCNAPFYLDTDNDGEAQKDADGKFVNYYCHGSTIGVKCPDLKTADGKPYLCKQSSQ